MKTIDCIIVSIIILTWLMWLMRQVLKHLSDDYVEFKDDNNDLRAISDKYPDSGYTLN